MLRYAVTFMVIALIAGAMGFGLVGGMAYGAAKICFFVFLVCGSVTFEWSTHQHKLDLAEDFVNRRVLACEFNEDQFPEPTPVGKSFQSHFTENSNEEITISSGSCCFGNLHRLQHGP